MLKKINNNYPPNIKICLTKYRKVHSEACVKVSRFKYINYVIY